MDSEFEAKFYPIDKDVYRKKLASLGAKLIKPERTMFRSVIDKRLNPGLRCSFLRVRNEGDHVSLSAKTSAQSTGEVGDQKEIEIKVSDYAKTIEILKLAGLSVNLVQESMREEWELEGAQITLDTWPGLETYSEIEASSESEVKRLALKIGFSWDKKIITAAAEIFAERYHLSIDETLEKISNLTFADNPFNNLPTYPVENSQIESL